MGFVEDGQWQLGCRSFWDAHLFCSSCFLYGLIPNRSLGYLKTCSEQSVLAGHRVDLKHRAFAFCEHIQRVKLLVFPKEAKAWAELGQLSHLNHPHPDLSEKKHCTVRYLGRSIFKSLLALKIKYIFSETDSFLLWRWYKNNGNGNFKYLQFWCHRWVSFFLCCCPTPFSSRLALPLHFCTLPRGVKTAPKKKKAWFWLI